MKAICAMLVLISVAAVVLHKPAVTTAREKVPSPVEGVSLPVSEDLQKERVKLFVGRVVDRLGKPIEDASVTVGTSVGVSGEDGTFSVAVEAFPCEVVVSGDSVMEVSATIKRWPSNGLDVWATRLVHLTVMSEVGTLATVTPVNSEVALMSLALESNSADFEKVPQGGYWITTDGASVPTRVDVYEDRIMQMGDGPLLALQVKVVDGAGAVVPNASVAIQRESGYSRTLITDDTGTLTLHTGYEPGMRVVASHESYASTTSAQVSKSGVIEMELILSQGVTVVGTVVDGEGKPVEAAEVSVIRNSTYFSKIHSAFELGVMKGPIPPISAGLQSSRLITWGLSSKALSIEAVWDGKTDVAGRFELPGQSLGELRLRILHPSYIEKKMKVTVTGELDLGRIVLDGGWRGEVTVVDESGRAIANAFVQKGQGQTWATSGVIGPFAQKSVVVFVSAPGYERKSVTLRKGQGTTVPLRRADRVLRGIATAPNDRPIAGAKIELIEYGLVTFSDADGVFRFEGVTQGNHTIRVSHSAFLAGSKQMSTDDVTSLALVEGVTHSCLVIDGDNDLPLENVILSAGGKRYPHHRYGRYKIGPVTPKPIKVNVRIAGFQPVSKTLTHGDECRFELFRVASISGTVWENGSRSPGATLTCGKSKGTADKHGDFSMKVPTGNQSIRVKTRSGRKTNYPINLDPEEDRNSVDIHLD